MKKLIAFILVLMLIVSMTVPVYAATIVPINKTIINYKMPVIKVPNIPASVTENINATVKANVIKNLIKSYPIK